MKRYRLIALYYTGSTINSDRQLITNFKSGLVSEYDTYNSQTFSDDLQEFRKSIDYEIFRFFVIDAMECEILEDNEI